MLPLDIARRNKIDATYMNPTSVVGKYCPPSRGPLAAASTWVRHVAIPYRNDNSMASDFSGLRPGLAPPRREHGGRGKAFIWLLLAEISLVAVFCDDPVAFLIPVARAKGTNAREVANSLLSRLIVVGCDENGEILYYNAEDSIVVSGLAPIFIYNTL